jgi:hypothetical protein
MTRKRLGYSLGDFFHKLIWSPWLQLSTAVLNSFGSWKEEIEAEVLKANKCIFEFSIKENRQFFSI